MIFSILFYFLAPQIAYSQRNNEAEKWVDSVYNTLTIEQRLGQMLMLRANSTGDQTEVKQLSSLITTYNIGGLCFFKGGPLAQAKLTNYYQSIAPTPLLISMDAEWGLGMRLDSVISFPRAMTMGAIRDENLLIKYGEEIGRQMKMMGIQMSFAPVADINNNPKNPVIHIRSFGENKYDVARKAILYMKGLKNAGLITVAKHFPGHGDTDTDSHLDLPVMNHSLQTLDSLELYPFRELIKAGVDGVMVAHLNVPALDPAPGLPASLSKRIIDSLLITELKFKGLVITDALDMKGVANTGKQPDLALKALLAGNDILLLPFDIDSVIKGLKDANAGGVLPDSLIELKCKKILYYKYLSGLSKPCPAVTDSLYEKLNCSRSQALNQEFYNNSVTLLKNNGSILPLQRPDTLKIASLTIGYSRRSNIQDRIDFYTKADHFTMSEDIDDKQITSMIKKLQTYDLILLFVNNTHPSPANRFSIKNKTIAMADSLLLNKRVIFSLFAPPYALDLFKYSSNARALIMPFQDNPQAYESAVQLIFGGISASGKLPVSSGQFKIGSGINTKQIRLGYSLPEMTGIAVEKLSRIDSIVNEGLANKAYPGCQVLVTYKNQVIYDKSFGYHTYDYDRKVKNTDLYDIASVTKVAATTLEVMKLYGEGKLKLLNPLSVYIPELQNTNKKKLVIYDVLAHQAQLQAWIPFYKSTLKNGMPDPSIYHKAYSDEFPVKITDSLFIKKEYKQVILDSIYNSPLLKTKGYKYSDLGFILMQQVVERIEGKSLDQLTYNDFYKPLGLNHTAFHPLEKFPKDVIAPTEMDNDFRKQLIIGYVHDPAAAMLGGVSGHAGLFSNAEDMAVIFQMLLNNGSYGGQKFLDSATIHRFTSRATEGNRRGLGFDKPQINRKEEGPACELASDESYGHTGFTGTYVWADPKYDLIIVFLSNRVYPDAANTKLTQLGIRTRIQEAVYKALPATVK